MRIPASRWRVVAAFLAASLAMVAPAAAEEAADGARKEVDTEALARAAQNPVADMISIPFQDDIGFGYGPGNKGTQNVLNIQPVIPLHVTEDWNVITRTILPIVSQPSFTGGAGTTGLGDLTVTAFLSPAKPGASSGAWGPWHRSPPPHRRSPGRSPPGDSARRRSRWPCPGTGCSAFW